MVKRREVIRDHVDGKVFGGQSVSLASARAGIGKLSGKQRRGTLPQRACWCWWSVTWWLIMKAAFIITIGVEPSLCTVPWASVGWLCLKQCCLSSCTALMMALTCRLFTHPTASCHWTVISLRRDFFYTVNDSLKMSFLKKKIKPSLDISII